jgi:hypothetical protein
VVDYNNSPINQVYSNFSGRIKFINCTDSRAGVIVQLDAGEIWLDSSCTAGAFVLKGVGVLTNMITGGTADISTEALVNNVITTQAIWDNPTRTLTQSISVTGGGATAQEVWDYGTRTLTQGITGGGATAQEVWEYQERTLTQMISGGASAADVWGYVTRTLTAGTRDTEIDLIKAKTDNLPGGIKKNVAMPYFTFSMISATDGKTLLPGLVITAQRKLDAGAFAACANASVGVGNGVYLINLEAADMNGDIITFKFTAASALDRIITIKTNP